MKISLIIVTMLVGTMHVSASSDSLRHSINRITTRVQFAGNQGLLSAGVLMPFAQDRIQIGLMYGFAPAVRSTPNYHSLILRTTWSLRRFPVGQAFVVQPYAALSGTSEIGNISFFNLPSQYPDGYYGPQSFHALMAGGLRLFGNKPSSRWSFNVESVVLDTMLWYWISEEGVDFDEIWSLSFGVEFRPFDSE